MNNINVNTTKNKIKSKNKKVHIQRNRRIVFISLLLISLLIIGTSIKNMYVSYRCSDLVYAIDHYFTNWDDKNLRLINVELFNVLSKVDNTIEIEAYGFGYEKPFDKKYLIGTFTEDTNGTWIMTSVKLKDNNLNIKTDNDDTTIKSTDSSE